MGSIDLSSHVSPGYVVVALRGELDISGAASIALVRRILSLTGLIDLLPVFASAAEATSGDGRGPAPVGLTAELADG